MNGQDTPLVTFVVPCYNAAEYMRRAIDSLLIAERTCEILLINDGSSDDTSAIAHDYADRYENIRAIDQENTNWGGVVNRGIAEARGTFFKVLDSDDRFEPEALRRVLDALAATVRFGDRPDLLITNYVYDHLPSGSQRVMQYRTLFPQNRLFNWSEIGKPGMSQFLMIHATWYATEILRESEVQLPTGVPYMDGLLLLHPMPLLKKMLYLDVEPYYYAIGREGQSVDDEVIKKHIDQQLFAARMAIDDADYATLFEYEPNCAKIMAGYMQCTISVSTLNLFTIGTPEAIEKNNELWRYLEEYNPALYDNIRHSWVGAINRKSALGRFVAVQVFKLGKKYYKLA